MGIFPIFWSYYREKKFGLPKNIISPFLIGGFVEMHRALLYMPRIGKKVKEYIVMHFFAS